MTITKYDQDRELPLFKTEFPEFRKIGSQCLQDVVERLDKAYQAFFRRVKGRDGKAGFPRFRSVHRYDSFALKQARVEAGRSLPLHQERRQIQTQILVDNMIQNDPWLDRWLPLLGERSDGRAVLELGCGTGRDTATLNNAGFRVIAIDLSRSALLAARARVPNAEFHCRNILDPFPVEENGTGIIVASLSLHYFPWTNTLNLVQRIQQTLQPKGILLCRLNSTNDTNFGAAGHECIAENYYLVNGRPKRFFDRKSVDNLFSDGWNVLNIEELTINRYAFPKKVWEIVLERRI